MTALPPAASLCAPKRYRVVTSSDLFPTKMDQSTYPYQYIYYTDVNGALASALSAVNADEMPVVAFDTGHSEMLDMSSYKDLLSDNNFDTVDFNLLTEEIPEDTQIIVLGVPSTDLTSEEVEKLNTYLNDTSSSVDRSVLIVSYPGQGELPTLNSYLGEWGMSVTPSEVLEGDSTSYIQSPDMILATVSDELDLDGESSYGYIVSPQTNPIEILWEGRNSVSTYPLLTTSSSAYLYDITTGEEQTDTAGIVQPGCRRCEDDQGRGRQLLQCECHCRGQRLPLQLDVHLLFHLQQRPVYRRSVPLCDRYDRFLHRDLQHADADDHV